jgi:DNA-binding transcriptional LysR family regulator
MLSLAEVITWDRLRVFAALAEHGSVTATAAALHLTGPAVTQHVRKLERETGCRLVEPDGRGIRLTAAGHVLAGHARSVHRAVGAAERDLAEIHGLVAGPLRIGSVASALCGLVPAALAAVLAEHERVEPIVRNGEVPDLLADLRARRLDVAVIESWSGTPARMPPGARLVPLLSEDVRIAVPVGHRLADREVLRLDELAGEAWAACPPGSGEYEAVLHALREHDIEADIRYRVGDFPTQLSLVAAGLALAAVPRLGRFYVPPGVRFVRSEPALHRDIAALTHADAEPPTVRVFLEALRAGPSRP